MTVVLFQILYVGYNVVRVDEENEMQMEIRPLIEIVSYLNQRIPVYKKYKYKMMR